MTANEQLKALHGLEEIALQVDWWREYDKTQRDKEGLDTTDDTSIMCPPTWPSHGQLKAWSKALRTVAALFLPADGEGEPVAYAPIHPRLGTLWGETYPVSDDVSERRSGSYELMPLYSAPSSPDAARMREALEREEKYLIEHFDADCGIMPGDIEGAFHRLREASSSDGTAGKADPQRSARQHGEDTPVRGAGVAPGPSDPAPQGQDGADAAIAEQ